MPKPTRDQIFAVLTCFHSGGSGPWTSSKASDLGAMIDAAWAEDAAERERGRNALEIVGAYAGHHSGCNKTRILAGNPPVPCTCGFDEALAALRGDVATTECSSCGGRDAGCPTCRDDGSYEEHERKAGRLASPEVRSHDAAMWEYAEEDAVEQFNREQRLRREAYEDALEDRGHAVPQERASAAARRYPLKKRVPATVDDPGGNGGRWTYQEGSKFFYFHGPRDRCPSVHGPAWTAPRVRALSALLDSHWVFVDDVEVET